MGPTSNGWETQPCTPIVGGVAATFFATLAGYGFAMYRFEGSRALFYVMIAALLVPITAITLPLYLMYTKVGLINSPWGMILPSAVTPVGAFIMRTYIVGSVPRELIAAARIDGAGELRIFFRIALPLVGPGFTTVLLLSIVGIWNNYFLPLIIFSKNSLYPLTQGIGLWSKLSGRQRGCPAVPADGRRRLGHHHPAGAAVPGRPAVLARRTAARQRRRINDLVVSANQINVREDRNGKSRLRPVLDAAQPLLPPQPATAAAEDGRGLQQLPGHHADLAGAGRRRDLAALPGGLRPTNPVTPRYRQYGFLNDSEFVKECHDRGIKAFSVIFCLQGWEFPAELSEDEDEVLALNELRGAGKRTGWGCGNSARTATRRSGSRIEHYFPDGLTNSAGEPVTDLWEECTSRDLKGEPIHADWLECPDREHACYLMDSNNPVWREYLKAIIRIHVDAGVDGIQFDEPDGPIAALRYGGCFCRDCVAGFRRYLAGLPAGQVPADIRPLFPDFDYGEHLRGLGHTRIEPREPDFLARAYAEFQRRCTTANLRELIGYARSYANSAGRSVQLSANLFDGLPCFAPLAADLDVLVPEQRHTLYRQPSWMRYIAGFGGGKPVAVEVNPYGGVLPELAEALRDGRGLGHFRGMLYEAAACGVTMSVPYGAWMGSVIEDAFYAPHEATVEIQDFLANHESLYGAESFNEIAVAHSVESNFIPVTFGNLVRGEARSGTPDSPWGTRTPFTSATDSLADDRQPFDVLMFHDGQLAEDAVTSASLAAYRELDPAGMHRPDGQPAERGARIPRPGRPRPRRR